MARQSPRRLGVPRQITGRMAAWGAVLLGILLLSACGGDDITALPEAKGLCNGQAGTPVVVDFASRSWWSEDGAHQSGAMGYLVAGWSDDPLVPVQTMRGYAVFDLTALTGCVKAAALQVTPETSLSADPSESFSVWEVTTDQATLDATATPPAVFPQVYADLGDGIQYGSFTVGLPGGIGSVHTVPLSPYAALAITNRMGGTFALGLRADSLAKPVGTFEALRFGTDLDGTPTRLLLELVP